MTCAACQTTTSKDVPPSWYKQLRKLNTRANEAYTILDKNVTRISRLSKEKKRTLDDITKSETLCELFKLVSRLASSLQTALNAKSRTPLLLCTPCLEKSCMVEKGKERHFPENGLDLSKLNDMSKIGVKLENSATADSLQILKTPLSDLPLFLTAWITCISWAELESFAGGAPDPVLYVPKIKRKLLDYSIQSKLRPTMKDVRNTSDAEVKPVPPLKVGQTLGSSNPASSTSQQRGKGKVSEERDTMQDVLSLTSEVTQAIKEWKYGAPVNAVQTEYNTPTELSLFYQKRGQLYSATAIKVNGIVYF